MATGFLLFTVGVWLVLRSVRPDKNNKTLVDHILP